MKVTAIFPRYIFLPAVFGQCMILFLPLPGPRTVQECVRCEGPREVFEFRTNRRKLLVFEKETILTY